MDVVKAVRAHFEAKREEALVRYQLYTSSQVVAIGDHSNIVEEAIKALEDYERAVSCLEQVSKL
jgi:hypothetical protein